MYTRFVKNEVLANLAFLLVIIIGSLSYLSLPRQQDPEVNFNWIQITTTMRGASAEDIERRVTSPLEDGLRNVTDIRFVISQSRDNLSLILVRFNELSSQEFNKRLTDLRREVQNKSSQLPSSAETPFVFEITTSNGFPTATLLVTGQALDENLRRHTKRVNDDITRFREVDRITESGSIESELQVKLALDRLTHHGLNPMDVAQQIVAVFQDISAGDLDVGSQNWLIRLSGIHNNPSRLANTLIQTYNGKVPLSALANVERGREAPTELITHNGKPAILLAIAKAPNVNTLELVDRINEYIEERNQISGVTGVELVLVDDQTQSTRHALQVMQVNALLGLLMVLLVTYLFLGLKISLLTSIAIPFVLAGVFLVLNSQEQSLNIMVLLGVVISLGMLVDDAVVVVESIYYRLERGADTVSAVVDGLKEVVAPVTASVLTTIAAFLPLILLPGIIGQFLQVVPLVVTLALIFSLIEVYWMLPAHIIGFKVKLNNDGGMQRHRQYYLQRIRNYYCVCLIRALRYPWRIILSSMCVLSIAVFLIIGGMVKVNFFANDTLRLFYINLDMPPSVTLIETLKITESVENMVRKTVRSEELRSVVSTAGQQITETSPLAGNNFGQITVSLLPQQNGMDSTEAIIEKLKLQVDALIGPLNISFLRLSSGPPTTSPIELKIQGNDFKEIRQARDDLQRLMTSVPGIKDIRTVDSSGRKVLSLELNQNAIIEANLSSDIVRGSLVMIVDGQVIAAFQDKGEEVLLRIKTGSHHLESIDDILSYRLVTPSRQLVPLSELVKAEYINSPSQIVHYNFLRTITLEADIDSEVTNIKQANTDILSLWKSLTEKYPNLQLDQSGLLDDLNDSIDNILTLFSFGLMLMYLIIATQFRSYIQPLIILFTVCLAFIGVVFGLALSGHPFSLYTMYGAVALSGISVNSAIVLISAANDRQRLKMSALHSIIYAGRRRVVSILITSMTTIGGLLSLAIGVGGKSALWGPIAVVIVSGLLFSTILTLFVIPGLYLLFERMKNKFGY